MKRDSLGSVWRRCDLHFHTPSSYDYKSSTVTNEQIVETLVSAEIDLVAITDHHRIDTERIQSLQSLAGERLTILPGIELRSELGGQYSVHLIALFPEDAELEDVRTKLEGKLSLTPTDIEAKGPDSIYVDFRESANLVHDLGGLVSVHAGRKSNSIEQVSNNEKFKQAMKSDLLRDAVNILEVTRPDDVEDYLNIVFPDVGKHLPIVICSDNHDAGKYGAAIPCWLKIDATFAGLRQVLNEPADRVYLGDCPPSVLRVANNTTKYIKSLTLRKSKESTLSETWFDQSIKFNSGLVAIIGNKGSGKSALADTIGLLGDAAHSDAFSFLNPDKFRNPKANLAQHFEATLEWHSGQTVRRSLNDDVEEAAAEAIKYIPQRYLETICNELKQPTGSKFDRELQGVIFSHVSEAERLGCDSLAALLEFRTEETEKSIAILVSDLQAANKKVIELEEKLTDRYRQRIEKLRDQKKIELDAHEQSKPEEVAKPEADKNVQAAIASASEQIATRQETLEDLVAQLKKSADTRKGAVRRISVAEKLLGKLGNIETQMRNFEIDAADEMQELSLAVGDLISVEIKREPIEGIRKEATELAERTERESNPEAEGSLANKKARLEEEILGLEAKLDAPNKKS